MNDEAHRRMAPMSGRHTFYAVLQHLKINDGLESTRTLLDFTALKFPGDDVDALGEWIHRV